jgi:hypothetical protein
MDRTADQVAILMRTADEVERRLRALEARGGGAPGMFGQRLVALEAQSGKLAQRLVALEAQSGKLGKVDRDGLFRAIVGYFKEQIAAEHDQVLKAVGMAIGDSVRPKIEALEAAQANRIAEHRDLLDALEACSARIAALEAKAAAVFRSETPLAKQPKAPARKARAKRPTARTSRPKSKPRRKAA